MASFETTLYAIGDWTILHLPMDVSSELPSRGQVMVKGTINHAPFAHPLEPDGNGGHWLNVDKTLQKTATVSAGDKVAVTLESTKDWPEPVIPADVQKAIDADQQVAELWADVTPMARWEWLRWIDSTANAETRQRRIEVSCSKLLSGLRRPCCFNRNMCCVPQVSKNGILLEPANDRS